MWEQKSVEHVVAWAQKYQVKTASYSYTIKSRPENESILHSVEAKLGSLTAHHLAEGSHPTNTFGKVRSQSRVPQSTHEIMLRAGEVCRMTCPLFPAPNLDGIDFSTLVCWSLLQLVFQPLALWQVHRISHVASNDGGTLPLYTSILWFNSKSRLQQSQSG